MDVRPTGTIVAMLAACATVQSEHVAFFNESGAFEWEPHTYLDEGNGLDIRQPASQSGAENPASLLWFHLDAFELCDVGVGLVQGESSAVRIARSADEIAIENDCGVDAIFRPPALFGSGMPIGPDASWAESADLYPVCFGDCENEPFLGDGGIIGVELTIDDEVRYGWVELERVGVSYQPIAWGFETEPGVPITVGCYADADGDGVVGLRDFNLVLGSWGRSVPAGTSGDVTGDGSIDQRDANAVLGHWGVVCR